MTTTIADQQIQEFAQALASQLRQSRSSTTGTKGFDGSGDGAPIRDKAWWNDVFNVVTQVAPVVIGALSGQKDLTERSAADEKAFWDDVRQIASTTLPVLLQALSGGAKGFADGEPVRDKAWWNDVFNVVRQVAPVVISAVSGQKGPHGDDKAFWDDVLHVVTSVAPIVLSAVL
jgi:hypothetical protein